MTSQVEDLDDAVAGAVALGAQVAESQPQDNVRVLLDPAGRPFLPVPGRRRMISGQFTS
jgi:Glyoxalase-like domain